MTSALPVEDQEADRALWTVGVFPTRPTWLEGARRVGEGPVPAAVPMLMRPRSPELSHREAEGHFTSGLSSCLWGRAMSFITRFLQKVVVGPKVIGTRCWALNSGP